MLFFTNIKSNIIQISSSLFPPQIKSQSNKPVKLYVQIKYLKSNIPSNYLPTPTCAVISWLLKIGPCGKRCPSGPFMGPSASGSQALAAGCSCDSWLTSYDFWLTINDFWLTFNDFWLTPYDFWLTSKVFLLASNDFWLMSDSLLLTANGFWLTLHDLWRT